MQEQTKRVFTPTLFIIFCLIILTLGQFSPIEITITSLSFVFYSIVIIGFPIVSLKRIRVLITRMKNRILITITKVATTILGILYIFYAILFSFGNAMCGNLTDETLFIKNDSSKIIVRHYDCGATDSDRAKHEVVKIVNYFHVFNVITQVDTSEIDKSTWVKPL